MNELLEAQKVVLKQETQEAHELLESVKQRVKRKQKIDMLIPAFAAGSCFALCFIGIRDANYLVAFFQFFLFLYFAWRISMEITTD